MVLISFICLWSKAIDFYVESYYLLPQISSEAIKQLLQSPAFTTSFKRVSASHGLALPLKFSSPLSELNLLSVLSLLNFASGYRAPLHAATGRGAWDSIRALVLSLYLTTTASGEDLLSAKGLQTISVAKVAELMRINPYIEKPHESVPGVVMGQLGGPLHELTQLITSVLNETGQVLVNSGYPDLGTFVAECLKMSSRSPSEEPDAEVVLEKVSKIAVRQTSRK
jgi:hypothetical protein